MRLVIRLAVRNLLRNKRRSILTLLAVFIPIVLLDISWGFTGAVERSLFEDTTRLQTGHFQIHKAGYEEIGETISLMRDVRPAVEALRQNPDVEFFTVQLDLPALMATPERSKGVLVQGVEPSRASQISLIQNWVRDGVYLQDIDEKKAVVGTQLIQDLKLGLGDPFVLISSHPETGTGVLTGEIVGSIRAPIRDINRAIMQIPIADARKLVKIDNAGTAIVALVKNVHGIQDAGRINEVVDRIQAQLGDEFVVEAWDEIAPEIMGYLNIARPVLLAFMLIFFLLAGLVVVNTIYLNLLERTKELGVILALGAGRRRILRIITTEALVLSTLGALIATALGIGLVLWGSGGVALPEIYEGVYEEVGINPDFKLTMTAWEAALSALIMIFIAVFSAWIPARRAAKLDPVDAMRAK